MDLPCLIAEQFCISLASVLSFLENLTICFFSPGLNKKRQKIIDHYIKCTYWLWNIQCFPPLFPFSPSDKLWNWQANYIQIFTQLGMAFQNLIEKPVDERQQFYEKQPHHLQWLLCEELFYLFPQQFDTSARVGKIRLGLVYHSLVKLKKWGFKLWIYRCCGLKC